MALPQPSKLMMWVRFPLHAPISYPLSYDFLLLQTSDFSNVSKDWMYLAIIIVTMVSSKPSSENTFTSFILYPLALCLPISIGLMILKFKFRKIAGSIPRAELVFLIQNMKGIAVENAAKGAFSLYLTLMIYLWFSMVLAAVAGPLIIVLVS